MYPLCALRSCLPCCACVPSCSCLPCCACGSLLTYDFFAKIKKNATEKELLKDGRIIMVVLLLLCMIIAPFIRNFKGLFDYLLAVWAFLAPGVFVTVLFGLFYKKSTEKAAFWTLVI